jgi:hypothetical protein
MPLDEQQRQLQEVLEAQAPEHRPGDELLADAGVAARILQTVRTGLLVIDEDGTCCVANRELEQFASVAAHDLQEPIRKIRAFGETFDAEIGAGPTPNARRNLDKVLAAAGRARAMIAGVLALSRASTRPLTIEPVGLDVLLRDLVADLETQLERTGGEVQAIGRLPVAQGDALMLRRLVQNLVTNGLKFHREGGARRRDRGDARRRPAPGVAARGARQRDRLRGPVRAATVPAFHAAEPACRVRRGGDRPRPLPPRCHLPRRHDRRDVNSFITKPVTFIGLVEAMRALGHYWFGIVELPTAPPRHGAPT